MDYKGQHEWDKPLAAIITVGAAMAILAGLAVCASKSSTDRPKKDNRREG